MITMMRVVKTVIGVYFLIYMYSTHIYAFVDDANVPELQIPVTLYAMHSNHTRGREPKSFFL